MEKNFYQLYNLLSIYINYTSFPAFIWRKNVFPAFYRGNVIEPKG